MSSITLSSKKQSLYLSAWRNIIEHLSERDHKICACICHTLRIMALHDPAANLEKMRERRALWVIPLKPLSPSIGPSELFLNSLKESLPDIQQLMSEDPNVDKVIRDIFAKERINPEYIPVYHAMNMETFIAMVFVGIVHSCIPHSSSVTSFIRFPCPKGPKMIKELFQIYPPDQYLGYDWADPVKKELLSCNPHLFGNVHWAGESTFSFYKNGSNISPPPIKELLQELSLNYHLALDGTEIDQIITCQKVFFDLAKKFNQLKLKKKHRNPEINRGVIWQFLIPPAVLDRVAYASASSLFGKEYPSPTGLSLSQRCLDLRKDPFKEKDLQIRFLAQAMFVPEHDIHAFVHGGDFFFREKLEKPEGINEEDWNLQQKYVDQKNQLFFYVKYLFRKKLLAIPQKSTSLKL